MLSNQLAGMASVKAEIKMALSDLESLQGCMTDINDHFHGGRGQIEIIRAMGVIKDFLDKSKRRADFRSGELREQIGRESNSTNC
jgi:hypothetical protein